MLSQTWIESAVNYSRRWRIGSRAAARRLNELVTAVIQPRSSPYCRQRSVRDEDTRGVQSVDISRGRTRPERTRRPPIPQRRGPPNNSARRFPGMRSLAISFAIVIPPLRRSDPWRRGWGSMRCSPRHAHRGRTRMRSGSSAPSDASVSITSSSRMNSDCLASEASEGGNKP